MPTPNQNRTPNSRTEMEAAFEDNTQQQDLAGQEGGEEREPLTDPSQIDWNNLPPATKTFTQQTVFLVTVCDLHTGVAKAFNFKTWNDADKFYKAKVAQARGADKNGAMVFYDTFQKTAILKKKNEDGKWKVRAVSIGDGNGINGLSSGMSKKDIQQATEGLDTADF